MGAVNFSGAETGDFSEASSTSGTVSVTTSNPRSGTYAYRCNPSAGQGQINFQSHSANGKVQTDWSTELFDAVWLWIATAPDATAVLWQIGAFRLRLNSDRTLQAQYLNGSFVWTDHGSPSPAIALDAYAKISYYIHAVAGDYEARLNDTAFASATGLTLGAATVQSYNIGLNGANVTADVQFDDLYVDDADWPEDIAILIAVPTGDSASNTHWTASTGDKWECINELPPDEGDYIVSGTTAGARDYSATHASAATLGVDGDIVGVKTVAIMRENSSTSTLGAIGIRSGSTDFATTEVDIGTTALITMAAVYALDPNTSAAWADAAFDAAEPLVRRSASDTSSIRCAALYLMVAWVEQPVFTGTASLVTPFPIMTASGLKVHEATSALALPFPVMVADGDKIHIGSSSLVLPFPIMVASGIHTELTREGTASLVLPFPIMTASGLQVLEGAGSFILPFPIMVSSGMHTDLQGVASLVLPFPILTASGEQVISGTGVFTLPFPILSASGLEVYTAVASMVLPFPILEAMSSVANIAASSLTMPFPVMVASGTIYGIGTANLTLPFPILVAQAVLVLPIHVFEALLQMPEYNSTVRVPNYSSLILLPDPGDVVPMPTTETTIHIPNQSAPRSL